MAGNPNYTVSTAQQYIGQAPAKTLRRGVQRIVPQQQDPTQEKSSGKPRLPSFSPNQCPSPFDLAAMEADVAERQRVREILKRADFPLAPESREHSLLLAIQQDEEAEADELAAWGESLLNPEARGAYSDAVRMAAREVHALVRDMETPGSKKRVSFWEEELLAPVVYTPETKTRPEKKAEMIVLAPMARSGSTKGKLVDGELVKLAPFTYSPKTSPQVVNTTASKLTRLSTLDTAGSTKVKFAPQTPTDSDQAVPDVDAAYEYLEASMPLGRGGSRKGHTLNSSGGTEIYFSPIDATRSMVFLSSPQPSPPNSPEGNPMEPEVSLTNDFSHCVPQSPEAPLSAVEVATARLEELVLEGYTRGAEEGKEEGEKEKVTLTLQQVDRLSVALARSSLVTKHVQRPFYDPRSKLATAKTGVADTVSLLSNASTSEASIRQAPSTPPRSESAEADDKDEDDEEIGGLAILKSYLDGAPIKCASNTSMKVGQRTHLTLPPGSSHSARLRIEPATHPAGESKIILQLLEAVVDRKSGASALTLLSETDVSHAFIRTALTEVARAKDVTLDEVEIQTPRAPTHSDFSVRSSQSSEETLDWAALDSMAPPSFTPTTPTTPCDDLTELTSTLTSLTPETCTMATLTLLSHLSSLKRHYHTFLLLQPTLYHEDGMLAGLKVPYASQSLQERFGEPGSSIHKADSKPKGFFNLPGSRFRTAIVGGVARHMAAGEEFEALLDMGEALNRCRCRCVPLRKREEARPSLWVCMVGGEFDLTVY